MSLTDPTGTLIIVDVQLAIDNPSWALHGPRNNTQGEANIARLLAGWRQTARPIVHVRHDSTEPHSTYRPGGPGHAFKPQAMPLPGETVVGKRVNSAFIGTDLEARLRSVGAQTLVICGVITDNSVEATVRVAGNLGFDVWLAEDACWTFARRDRRGRVWPAEDVHALTLAILDGEYCRIATTAEILASIGAA
ncbi:cysteine hydrolase family protein [Reyranella sp. CPCC 100927]|uniref:cysteine hydrolase family protein n=1 Tax=Reyranella sp. CPCC 100927 TaxID=2599616 RepID=UPI0011B7F61C|nr:cysteine hydrolase family protein [Reyranella sp. CPCC 100927]TWT15698.1 cysteine hydrolase [Reyranella sp. CPCC 100927]